MFCIIVVSGYFFFSSRDFMKSESNQNNKLFLLSQALSSLLLRSELSHTETDGSLTTMAFSCGSYCSNNIATDCNPFRKC